MQNQISVVRYRYLIMLLIVSLQMLMSEVKGQSLLDTTKSSWVTPTQFLTWPSLPYSIDQQKKMNSKMLALLEVVHQNPFLHPPKGYEVQTWTKINSSDNNHQKAIAAKFGMTIRAYYHDFKTQKPAREGEGPVIEFCINDISRLFGDGISNEDSFYEEPATTGTRDGFPIFNNKFVVIAKNNNSIFSYVTQENILTLQISKEEQDLRSFRENFSKGSVYQQWIKTKDENIKATMVGFSFLEKSDPNKAKIEKEKYLNGMKETENRLKAQETQELEKQHQIIENYEDKIAKLKHKLSIMTPQEKKSPALSGSGKKLVMANKNFYNATLAPSYPQIIIVDLYQYDLNSYYVSNLEKPMIKKLQDALNLKALLNVIEK